MSWSLLERLVNLFYDPLVFWGVPFLLAALAELRRR